MFRPPGEVEDYRDPAFDAHIQALLDAAVAAQQAQSGVGAPTAAHLATIEGRVAAGVTDLQRYDSDSDSD
jgi:hypothetical protein